MNTLRQCCDTITNLPHTVGETVKTEYKNFNREQFQRSLARGVLAGAKNTATAFFTATGYGSKYAVEASSYLPWQTTGATTAGLLTTLLPVAAVDTVAENAFHEDVTKLTIGGLIRRNAPGLATGVAVAWYTGIAMSHALPLYGAYKIAREAINALQAYGENRNVPTFNRYYKTWKSPFSF